MGDAQSQAMQSAADLLTIGTAAYSDPMGVYFTLRSLADNHPEVPLIVIDTTPRPCYRTRGIALTVGAKYFHRPDLKGTAAPRDAVFRLAKTPWVMVIDSHITMPPGVVQTAIDYCRENPLSKDLIQGPLIGDDGTSLSTHWRPTTPPGLWGVWDCAHVHKVDGEIRTDHPIHLEETRPFMDYRRMTVNDPPFPIPAQGLGQFMMRRDVWPGFHPLHRGFGAEEGYIHAKVRRHGGEALCHPGIGWNHFFRDMENGAPSPPYPLKTEDMVWNLLVTHRELGIEAEKAIFDDFGRNLPIGNWMALVKKAAELQPFGKELTQPPRLKILGVWYSNNAAPAPLMANSLKTIRTAQEATTRHDVEIRTCSWEPVGMNPFPWVKAARTAKPGHATIIEQQRQCVAMADADGFEWQVICFLEHDTLYPADYFDRVGNVFCRQSAVVMPDVVSNLDYEGLNSTGWLAVKERHEPMHQLALRRPFALWNFQRCQEDCDRQGWCYLEPQTDRRHWVRLPYSGGQDVSMPSIHVNFDGRFTSHGEVCYDPVAKTTTHPYWGKARDWWPGELTPAAECAGCTGASANQSQSFATPAEWLAAVSTAAAAPDCFEHLATVRDLAAQCEHATELNIWGSPWLAALMAGAKSEVASVAPGPMRNWDIAQRIPRNDGRPHPTLTIRMNDSVAVELDPTDLLLIDTHHSGMQLLAELTAHAKKVRRYIVLHDTAVFGETGDDGTPGLLAGLRGWVRQFPEWSVIRHDENNSGLTVLSRRVTDKPAIEPGTWRQVGSFVASMARHVGAGLAVADAATAERRLDTCALCPLRSGSRCAKCGCELETSPIGGPGKAFLPTEQCPVGKW